MLILWTTKSYHTMGTTTVALFGLIMLLILNIATWNQLIKNYKAWDTLIWLGGFHTVELLFKTSYGLDIAPIKWSFRVTKGMVKLMPNQSRNILDSF